jgi:hypothetical protein
MASLRKRGRLWYFTFVDHDGRKTERKGYTDKRATEDKANEAQTLARRIRNGEISPREAGLPKHGQLPLEDHFALYHASLLAKGATPKHADLAAYRARRVASVAGIDDWPTLTWSLSKRL